MTEKFSIKYDGPALAGHEMNVKDFAPALLAIGELFDEANIVLNENRTKIDVNIRATKEGSVDIDLSMVQSVIDQAKTLFSGDGVSAIVNAQSLLKLIFGGGVGSIGIVSFIKWLKGRNIENITTLEDGNLKIQVEGGETKTLKEEEINLFRLVSIRKKLETIIKSPLSKEGIDTFKVKHGDETEEIKKDESEFFSSPDIDEELIDEREIETNLTIVNASFQEKGKWRFSDGNSTFFAEIEDVDFLNKVEKNQAAFSKDDILQTNLVRKQFITNGQIRTEYSLKKIIKHRNAAIQLNLPFESGGDED
ncbi:MAG: hypothetical protein U9O20_02915 [Patescibacteria group bacterium]|nr:hypothetical protein [Patescibacteria group bacterium]